MYQMDNNKKKRKNYNEQAIIDAVAAVKNGASFRTAANIYDVPVTTVRDRYHGKYKEGKHIPGPATGLSFKQEQLLKVYAWLGTELITITF